MEFLWSPANLAFFPDTLMQEYIDAGWDLSDAVAVSDDVREEFGGVWPQGKILSSVNGMPAWVDIPLPPNSDLLKAEISRLGNIYKSDVYDLNTAYLAAIVSDSPQEVTKQQVVREQINQRKAQYAADIAAAKEKYPV
ncbi:tail assembly chaperone [Salmonella enterica]|nr:tail assembly chaperone [Salmonella enterica]EIU1718367.1 tail assembly chaperone [Salmonella enterica]EKD9217369.1 tail assembly chaperone [Salmonella enterica]EKI6027402.1 tail assembly chaperone [Salmonella enterica]ELZ3691046.1 tail assembly chaperone [Salmonella enterica]